MANYVGENKELMFSKFKRSKVDGENELAGHFLPCKVKARWVIKERINLGVAARHPVARQETSEEL